MSRSGWLGNSRVANVSKTALTNCLPSKPKKTVTRLGVEGIYFEVYNKNSIEIITEAFNPMWSQSPA